MKRAAISCLVGLGISLLGLFCFEGPCASSIVGGLSLVLIGAPVGLFSSAFPAMEHELKQLPTPVIALLSSIGWSVACFLLLGLLSFLGDGTPPRKD